MAKAYIFLANGFEEIEGLTVVDLLRRAGIEISMVSIMGTKEVTGSHKIKVVADEFFENINYRNADMLILPGGMPGTSNLLNHQGLIKLLKQFNQEGKMLAAICAAPSILGVNGILKGKKATCFPGYEEKLLDAIVTGNKIDIDSNIITAKGMGVSIDFALTIIEQLKDKNAADRVAESIQYR